MRVIWMDGAGRFSGVATFHHRIILYGFILAITNK